MASLANWCSAPGKPNTYIYDTLFPSTDNTADSVGSFHHYIGQDRTKKMDDVYDIRAKVYILLYFIQLTHYSIFLL
jgi:hypothetical protein